MKNRRWKEVANVVEVEVAAGRGENDECSGRM